MALSSKADDCEPINDIVYEYNNKLNTFYAPS